MLMKSLPEMLATTLSIIFYIKPISVDTTILQASVTEKINVELRFAAKYK